MINEQDFFSIDVHTQIILYGAASIGCLIYEKLSRANYNVIAFIDKRGNEIDNLYGLPVYTLDTVGKLQDAVVIVTVKNVFEHTRIANELIDHGFNKLIFRPYNCVIGDGDEQESIINCAYDLVMENQCGEIKIPQSYRKSSAKVSNNAILCENDNDITVLLPISLIFCGKRNMNKSIKSDMPILFLIPHIKFVKCVLGIEKCNTDLYVRYCESAANKIDQFSITEAWRKNVINNRREVFVKMNHLYDVKPDFFVEQAPYVQWNEKGYFNLCSGKHRAVFLAVKGKNYLPVKMGKEDYCKWVNMDSVVRLQEYIVQNCINELNAPIENPFFYDITCNDEQFLYRLLKVSIEKIAESIYQDAYTNTLNGKTVYLDLHDSGFFCRYFKRCGCIPYLVDADDENTILIDQLMNLDSQSKAEKEDSVFDFAIIHQRDMGEAVHRVKLAIIVTSLCCKHDNSEWMFSGIYRGEQVRVYLMKNADL